MHNYLRELWDESPWYLWILAACSAAHMAWTSMPLVTLMAALTFLPFLHCLKKYKLLKTHAFYAHALLVWPMAVYATAKLKAVEQFFATSPIAPFSTYFPLLITSICGALLISCISLPLLHYKLSLNITLPSLFLCSLLLWLSQFAGVMLLYTYVAILWYAC